MRRRGRSTALPRQVNHDNLTFQSLKEFPIFSQAVRPLPQVLLSGAILAIGPPTVAGPPQILERLLRQSKVEMSFGDDCAFGHRRPQPWSAPAIARRTGDSGIVVQRKNFIASSLRIGKTFLHEPLDEGRDGILAAGPGTGGN